MESESKQSYEYLHREHLNWLYELNFYQDEIKFFQNKLMHLSLNHLQKVNMEKVGEFRKAFMNMLLLIDDFRYQIFIHEKDMAKKLALNQKTGKDHMETRVEIVEFEKSFAELRTNFREFLSSHSDKVNE